MMILIIGGSGSGKSAFAEDLAETLFREETASGGQAHVYYLATMRVYDEEGRRRVERHRRLREKKGFFTIEQPCSIRKALEKMAPGKRIVLLECVGNLAANEMFSGEGSGAEAREEAAGNTEGDGGLEREEKAESRPEPGKRVERKIIEEMRMLKREVSHLLVVSNQISEDGIVYDAAVMEYLRTMGIINCGLAAMADRVVEVAAGIPIMIKEEG